MVHDTAPATGGGPDSGDHEDGSASGPALNMMTLCFDDPEVERQFMNENLRKTLPLIRLSFASAVILYASFGVLDFQVAGPALHEVLLIRFGFACPLILAVVGLTYTEFFFRISQLALSVAFSAAGIGVIAMTYVMVPPTNTYYYAGLIMVVIYGSTMVRLRFVNAAMISVMLLATYQVVALQLNPVPRTILINNDFFLVMATAVGIFASYIQEFYVRCNYVTTMLLRDARDRSATLLAESQAANHAKSEFLAVVSHELRTPLNAIIGFSEFLKMEMFGPLGSGRYRSYAEDIYSSGRHLLDIINDILDLSRAEANKLSITEEEVSLQGVIDSCMRMFRNKAAEQGVRLVLEDGPRPVVSGDQRLIAQVVINLVSNAIKFTPRGGAITVAIERRHDGALQLAVRDTGIGIAPENLPRIMEPFVQVESAASRSHDGLGLGLPLVKRIVELHGGCVEITSALARGTIVVATLPTTRVLDWNEVAPEPAAARRATGTH